MSSNTPRDLKRRRIEADEDQSVSREQWTRHPKLYMQDGTIVLLAGTTLFRVYGGLLSMHSEVFKDMLSLSSHQPSNAEKYDGCPLVRLSDSPQDLESFLEPFMDIKYFTGTQQAIPFSTVSGILRISTKYIVPKLRAAAIAHFDRCIPTTLDDVWTKRSQANGECFGDRRENWPQPFELVTLFRECDVPKFLPWVCYSASRMGIAPLLNGYTTHGRTLRLSPKDTQAILLGRQTLTAIDNSITVEIYSSITHKCWNPKCNADYKIAMLKDALSRRKNEGVFVRPDASYGACAPCIAHRQKVERTELEKT